MNSKLQSLVQSAADFIRRRFSQPVRHGIILGTGAGDVAKSIEPVAVIPYSQIKGFPTSTALGHQGQFICGTLMGTPILAMQGRFHLYEGYSVDVATLPIHVMHELGIKSLFVSNASGGLNPNYRSGEIMLIESHVDFLFRSTPRLTDPPVMQRPARRSDGYDQEFIETGLACGRRNGFPVHRGVYAALLGPNYETRAEYRMLRRIGADVAGMSTVPEVTVATRYAMRIMGLSLITNVAKPDLLAATSGQEVIAAAKTAAPHLQLLIADAIKQS